MESVKGDCTVLGLGLFPRQVRGELDRFSANASFGISKIGNGNVSTIVSSLQES